MLESMSDLFTFFTFDASNSVVWLEIESVSFLRVMQVALKMNKGGCRANIRYAFLLLPV